MSTDINSSERSGIYKFSIATLIGIVFFAGFLQEEGLSIFVAMLPEAQAQEGGPRISIKTGAPVTTIPLQRVRGLKNGLQLVVQEITGADEDGGLLLKFSPKDVNKTIKIQVVSQKARDEHGAQNYMIGHSKLGQLPVGFNERPYEVKSDGYVFVKFADFDGHTYNGVTYNKHTWAGISPHAIWAIKVLFADGRWNDHRSWKRINWQLPKNNGKVKLTGLFVVAGGVSPEEAKLQL